MVSLTSPQSTADPTGSEALRDELRRRAGERSFKRGEEYFRWGQIVHFAEWRGRVAARVLGARAYHVSLWNEGADLAFACDCPVGGDGRCCKHAVALGLYWLKQGQRQRDPSEDRLAMEQVQDDLHRQPDAALSEHSMVVASGDEKRRWIQRVLEWQLNQVSGGWDEESADEELLKLCVEVFVQGGERPYQELIAEHWRALSHIAKAQLTLAQRRQLTWLTRRMESRAKQSGWLDEIVAVKSQHLSEVETYLELAELYRQAGKVESAVEWAQRGLAAFPSDSRLRELLIGVYESGGRMEEALAGWWEQFVDEPSLRNYQRLKECALRLAGWPECREPIFQFLRQRVERAARVAQLGQTRKSKKSLRSEAGAYADHSELVRIWLAEGEVEAAWQAAQEGGCADEVWLELAARRIRQHPEESLAVYQGQIKKAVSRKNVYAYKEGVRLLRRVRRLLKRLGREAEFPDYLAKLSQTGPKVAMWLATLR